MNGWTGGGLPVDPLMAAAIAAQAGPGPGNGQASPDSSPPYGGTANMQASLVEIDGDSVAKIDFLTMARDAEMSSTSWFEANVRRPMYASLNQFYGRHDPETYYHQAAFRHKSKLFMPKTRAAVRKHEAMASSAYFSTKDIVQISPMNDDDPMQEAAADYYTQIMNRRLASSGPHSIQWFQNLIGAYQDAMVYGICISYQYWDMERDEPAIELLEPENFRFDPACNWVDPVVSSPYLIWKRAMTVGEIKSKIRRGEFEDVTDAQLASARRVETNSVSQARNQYRTDPLQRPNGVKEFDLVWVHMNVMQQGGVDWVFYTLGNEAYLTIPAPIDEVFLHGERPFVVGKCVIESHKNYPTSIPGMTRELQRFINETQNQRVDNMRLALDKRWLVKIGSRVDHESVVRNAPGAVTMVGDVEKDIKMLSHPDINPSAYKEQNLAEISMDDLSGGFNSATMQSNRSMNETVGGMTLISQSANQVAEYQLKTFNDTWVERVLFQLLMLEKKYETNQALMDLAGANAKLGKKFGLTPEDVRYADLSLSCQVGMGATNPATKLEKFTMAMGAFAQFAPVASQYGMDLKQVSKEIFGALGYHDGARFFSEDVDPQVAMLQQQLQQLQQKLDQKLSPEMESAQIALLKAQTCQTLDTATFGAMQAAQILASMPAIGPIADKIAETNGFYDLGGQNPNYGQPLPGDQSMAAQGGQAQPQVPPTSLGDSLKSIAGQDPDALVAAHEQASQFKMKGNNDPLTPIPGGPQGANRGIRGGAGK